MTTALPDWAQVILALLAMVSTAGAIYGAIKADLKAMHHRVSRLEDWRDRVDTLRVPQGQPRSRR